VPLTIRTCELTNWDALHDFVESVSVVEVADVAVPDDTAFPNAGVEIIPGDVVSPMPETDRAPDHELDARS